MDIISKSFLPPKTLLQYWHRCILNYITIDIHLMFDNNFDFKVMLNGFFCVQYDLYFPYVTLSCHY